MVDLFSFTKPADLSGYNLIIPSVSVGNVPQLTVDFLITTFKLTKAATVWHPGITPCVGSGAYTDHSDRCTACELYINEEFKVAAIQLRSSVEFKLGLKFFHDLKDSLSAFGLASVIILSSVFDYELHNVNQEKFFYIGDTVASLEKSNVRQLKKTVNGRYNLNGGGFAGKLYEVLSSSYRCIIVGKYTSEGDNRPDAYFLLLKLLPLLGIDQSEPKVVCPESWKFVFGGPPPIGIF